MGGKAVPGCKRWFIYFMNFRFLREKNQKAGVLYRGGEKGGRGYIYSDSTDLSQ